MRLSYAVFTPLKVTSVKLVEIRDCGSRRPDAVAPVEGCLQSVRLRAAIDGMADCAAGAARRFGIHAFDTVVDRLIGVMRRMGSAGDWLPLAR